MEVYMKKNLINKTSSQQVLKPYNPIKLTFYGKMVKLTAAGSLGVPEAGSSSSNKQRP